MAILTELAMRSKSLSGAPYLNWVSHSLTPPVAGVLYLSISRCLFYALCLALVVQVYVHVPDLPLFGGPVSHVCAVLHAMQIGVSRKSLGCWVLMVIILSVGCINVNPPSVFGGNWGMLVAPLSLDVWTQAHIHSELVIKYV
jgi:hypothetical protein